LTYATLKYKYKEYETFDGCVHVQMKSADNGVVVVFQCSMFLAQ